MSSATWDGQDQHMATGGDDDFHQFLDMSGMGNMNDTMQFDFQPFQDGSGQQIMGQAPGAQPRQHADTIMGNADASNMVPRSDGLLQNHTPAIAGTPNQTAMSSAAHMMATSAPTESISNIDAQIQYLQQQKFHQQQRQMHEQQTAFFTAHNTRSVPPTPQSIEIPPGSGQFYSQAEQVSQRTAYERSYHHRNAEQQDMAFTPLVSPAVTPLDPHFNMENAFAVPGSYFSPLTSPALVAQHDSVLFDHGTNSHNSPIDMDLETPTAVAGPATQDLAKKARKNNAKARTKSNSIKNSPIAKPLRKRVGPSPAIVSQALSEAEERHMQSGDNNLLPLPASSTDNSEENASVSPENLTDMPPPPVPARRSNSKSPYIQAQNGGQQAPPLALNEDRPAHPATPASLMKLAPAKGKKTSNHQQGDTATENIESLELPESLSTKKPLAPLSARPSPLSPSIEQGSSFRGPMSQPLASPGSRTPGTLSANASPSLGPRSTGPTAKRTPQLLSRNNRKRSTSSVQVSPALLPRISPNIKPLIPGTPGMSAEDTSRLLMSKSNYQNILEGNNVPGVSYPSELSTNLTSKRTSHKIAEQGRRNRINSALQIMAGLLPEGQSGKDSGDEADDKKDGKAASAPSSKASVVENAIVHMKGLQEENGALKKELMELKAQMEKLKGAAS